MAHMDTLRRIENNTPGTATNIDWNYQTIEAFVDGELIDRDGGVAMRSPLAGVDATNANEYATLGQVSALFFPGFIIDYAGATAPTGWAICDGSQWSATDPTYLPLYNVIGFTFGNPGGGNFNLPDLRDKSSVGVSSTKVLGSAGGSADVKQHLHEVPLHNHTLSSHTHTIGGHTHVTDIDHNHGSFSTASGGAHNHTGLSAPSVGTYGVFGLGDSGTQFQTIAIGSGLTNLLIGSSGSDHAHSINVPALGVDDVTTKDQTNGFATNGPSIANTGDKPATNTVNAGAGTDNYHPYLAVNKIIKL